MVKANLFFAGQKRTGTHALHFLFSQHPDVCMSSIKEPAYFAFDIQKESDDYHGRRKYLHYRTEKQYAKLFNHYRNEKYAGEASAIYFYSKTAADEIYKYNKDSKIIIMLREPADWLRSYHLQACHFVGEDRVNLRQAMELENVRKEGRHLPKNVIAPSLLYYSDMLNYTEHLRRYLDLFGRDNVKICLYEKFRENNLDVYYEIVEYLGIDSSFKPVSKTLNASKTRARFPRIHNMLRSSGIPKLCVSILPSAFKQRLVTYYWQNFFDFDQKPVDDQDLKKEIMTLCLPEVRKTSELIGIDLVRFWGYDKL